jgi:hypothetical protein
MATDLIQRIRERSYQIWEQEGRPEGQDLDHWLQAERELAGESTLDFEFKQLMHAFRNGISNCRWLQPRLVGMIEFAERTAANHLRHSKFVGLRDDKDANQVRREVATEA